VSRAKCILCRCEDVTLIDFRAAFAEGFSEFESLKRYTGLGTGFCQGKGCLGEAAVELSRLRGIDPAEVRPPTIRPPAEPLTFAELAALKVPEPPAPPEEPTPPTEGQQP
jgi:sarcosine oxidase subunit beta